MKRYPSEAYAQHWYTLHKLTKTTLGEMYSQSGNPILLTFYFTQLYFTNLYHLKFMKRCAG